MGAFNFFAKFLCPLFKTVFLCYNIEKNYVKKANAALKSI